MADADAGRQRPPDDSLRSTGENVLGGRRQLFGAFHGPGHREGAGGGVPSVCRRLHGNPLRPGVGPPAAAGAGPPFWRGTAGPSHRRRQGGHRLRPVPARPALHAPHVIFPGPRPVGQTAVLCLCDPRRRPGPCGGAGPSRTRPGQGHLPGNADRSLPGRICGPSRGP